MPPIEWMNHFFKCPYTEIVLSKEKKQTTDIGNNINEYLHLCTSGRNHK